jgi:hypothetical protein
MKSRKRFTVTIAAAATIAAGAGTALAAAPSELPGADAPVFERDDLTAVSRQFDQTRHDYNQLYEKAKKLGIAPKHNTADSIARDSLLEAKLASLKKDVRKETAPEYGTPESVGVSQSTLDSIASCESGGDPTAVDSSGTYRGKYQFDLGTWASVGGSGDPAAAPEAEQDYRAALLMSQAGSSPWPVCG